MAQSCKLRFGRLLAAAGVLFLASCGDDKGKTVTGDASDPLAVPDDGKGRDTLEPPSEVKLPKPENPPTAAMAANMSGAELFASVCAACHGVKGEGNEQLKSPSIAGLPDWYTKIQIEKFQMNFRGTDSEDPAGLQMHGIASILDAASTAKVAEEIAKLDLVGTVSTVDGGGDPEAGAVIYRERCMECHRFNGRGEVVFRSAPLIGFQDWYIVAQMKKYQAGYRGGVEGDVDGAKMHDITEGMTEQQMLDVAAHIVELAEKYVDWIPRRERRLMEAGESGE